MVAQRQRKAILVNPYEQPLKREVQQDRRGESERQSELEGQPGNLR